MNYEIAFWVYVGINIVGAIFGHFAKKKIKNLDEERDDLHKKSLRMLEECIQNRAEAIKKYGDALSRENYLLKTMNDAMKVTEPKGFMAQRMRNAPKEFEPKKEKDIKPDKID